MAPDTPTISYLFKNNEEILLFNDESEEELYLCIKKVCNSSDLLSLLAENLQEKIKMTYSEKNTFNFYNRLINEAITSANKNKSKKY